jgi:hypothetical protein
MPSWLSKLEPFSAAFNLGIKCDDEVGYVMMQHASCIRPTALVSCTELHHEDGRELLRSIPYCQFGLVVHTHDPQHSGKKKNSINFTVL